jgi:hypothetical protein
MIGNYEASENIQRSCSKGEDYTPECVVLGPIEYFIAITKGR